MKKLSKITESIWSDMQDRSIGITQRKEDDVNLMSEKDFCDYLNDNYIGKDGHKIIYDDIYKRIRTSILKKFIAVSFSITYDYKSNIITEKKMDYRLLHSFFRNDLIIKTSSST